MMRRLSVIAFLAICFTACNKSEEKVKTLPAPVISISGNSVVWEAVEGALNYLPEINGEEKDKIAGLSLDLSLLGAGNYTVRVRAMSYGENTLDSPWSNTVEHTIRGILAAPVPVADGKRVTWPAVDNASAYEFTINDEQASQTNALFIDLSERLTGTYRVTVRAISNNDLYQNSSWSAEVTIIIEGTLDTPVLKLNGGTFADALAGTDLSVSWDPVDKADSYIVLIDGQPVSFSGTNVSLSGYSGSHVISVQAVNSLHPELYPASHEATLNFSAKDYGTGTIENPYKLYDKEDWNSFAGYVSSTYSFTGKYITLANDIDFAGSAPVTAGASSTKHFAGLFDGANHGISNFAIAGDAGNAGLFACNSGTIKNLNVTGCTVSSSIAGLARIAVISAGQSGGTYENIRVSNCNVSATDAGASYAGIIMSQAASDATISNCSVNNCSIVIGKDMGGLITGSVVTGVNLSINSCSVSGGSVTTRSYSGGILGISSADSGEITISNCIVKNACINSTNNHSGGIVGQLNAGLIINCISDGNTVVCNSASTSGNGKYAGAIAGQSGVAGSIINNLSRNCTVKSQNSVTDQYISLVIGADIVNSTGNCYNNVVASGKVYYGANATKYVGIISGVRATQTYYSFNYYNASLQTEANQTDPTVELRAIGKPGIAGTSDLGGTVQVTMDTLPDLATTLNTNIDEKLSAFPLAKKWISGTDGWPTFDFVQ